MPSYLITSPDGKKYKVTGPGTKEEALAQVQAQVGQQPAKATINPDTMQPEGVPEFKPVGVEGYDPKTGEVTKGLNAKGTFAAAMPEGVPIAGPLLDKAAMAASAGIGSMISGDPYAKVRAEMRAMKDRGNERHPVARLGGNVAGAVATLGPIGGTRAGGYALGVRGPSILGRTTRSWLSGTGISAADAAARGGDQADIIESGGIGGAISAAVPVVGSALSKGASKALGAFNKAPARTTAETLNANKTAAYDLSEKAGVIIKPDGMKALHKKVVDDFTDFGFDPGNEPGAARVLARLEKDLDNNVTLKGLDTIRKLAGNAYEPGKKSNNALIKKVVDRIDELIESEDPALMAGLNTSVGAKSIKIAREYAKRARKLEAVEYQLKKGRLQGSSNKSQNMEQRGKKQILSIIGNEAKSRGFNSAEKAAAEKAVGYSTGERVLDAASGLFPSGKMGAMMNMVAAPGAFAAFGPAGLALQGAGMAAGFGARKWAEKLAAKSVDEFVDLVSRGGVPAPVVKNAMQLLAESKRSEVQRLLMSAGIAVAQ